MSTRRENLIERVRRLPDRSLAQIEALVANLERPSALGASDKAPVASAMREAKDWPHAPLHRLSEHGTFIVTAGTRHKLHLFRQAESLDLLESTILRSAKQFGWQLEAWAVFSNHYHFVAHALGGAKDLRRLLKQIHGETAHELNRRSGEAGRQVWHNFWDTELTYEKSYLARLNYVHQNAVKHGLVHVANQYRWCSAAWFERTATPAQVKTIYNFKTDRVRVGDDYDVVFDCAANGPAAVAPPH